MHPHTAGSNTGPVLGNIKFMKIFLIHLLYKVVPTDWPSVTTFTLNTNVSFSGKSDEVQLSWLCGRVFRLGAMSRQITALTLVKAIIGHPVR